MDHLLKKRLLALIYPTRCPVCGDLIFPHEDFCEICRSKLTYFSGSYNIPGAELFAAPFEYTDAVSPAVILLKKGIRGNAVSALGRALADCLKYNDIDEKIHIIVPVPMLKGDIKKRGFNQALLISKEVGRILKIDVARNCVVKIRRTEQQKLLNRHERQHNLRNAFEVADKEMISGKNVLLVDDVCTTGSTLTEITGLLLKNGAAKVYCGCCCKTQIKRDDENENRS